MSLNSSATAIPDVESIARPTGALRWSGAGLAFASWLSAALFGVYIIAFYLGAVVRQDLSSWNSTLPDLYDKDNLVAVVGMGAHLATGAVILLFGPVQLIGGLRRRFPSLHRLFGRIYVFTAAAAGIGGLAFILSKGTIGGPVMNVGFGLYGALMILAAVQTFRYARRRDFQNHRAWAVRLFALAIGSWLYRMDYGFWLIAAKRLGHTSDFRGPFDMVMSFFFYVPNLILAELFLRARRAPSHAAFQAAALVLLNLATLIVLIGTYYFSRYYWLPAIIHSIVGSEG